LDVSYFKPFKIAFQKVRNVAMASRNYIEPNKITLTKWVDQVLKHALTKRNIKSGFRAFDI
jgi:hypothetical protein